MISLLLKHGGNPNITNYMFGRTPLQYAVDCGHLECVQLMVEHGGDPYLKDKQGKTAMDLTKDQKIQQALCNSKNEKNEDDSDLLTSGFISPYT